MRPIAMALSAALTLTACSGGGDDQPSPTPTITATAQPSATPSPTASPIATPTPSTTDAQPSGPAAAPPTAPPATSPPSQPGNPAVAPTPPQAGTYRYDTQGTTRLNNGSGRAMPAVTSLRVFAPNGTRQTQVRDMRDDQGYGSVSTSVFDFGASKTLLHTVDIVTRLQVLGFEITDEQHFVADPPGVVAEAGAGVGFHSTFTLRGDGTTAKVTIDALRTETVAVGGQSVEAIVVRQVTNLSGGVTGTNTTMSWIRASDVLTLREEVDTDVTTSSNQRLRTSYTAVLQSLTPA